MRSKLRRSFFCLGFLLSTAFDSDGRRHILMNHLSLFSHASFSLRFLVATASLTKVLTWAIFSDRTLITVDNISFTPKET